MSEDMDIDDIKYFFPLPSPHLFHLLIDNTRSDTSPPRDLPHNSSPYDFIRSYNPFHHQLFHRNSRKRKTPPERGDSADAEGESVDDSVAVPKGEYETGRVMCEVCSEGVSFRDEATGGFTLKHWDAHRQQWYRCRLDHHLFVSNLSRQCQHNSGRARTCHLYSGKYGRGPCQPSCQTAAC